MTNIVVNIPTVQIPVVQTHPQAQNNSASSNNAQSGNQTSNTQNSQNTQSQQTQNNNWSNQANSALNNNASQGNNASQSGNANSASDQNSHFSQLLANNQQTNTSGTPAAKPANGKTDTSQTDTGNIGAAVAFIAAQLQAQPVPLKSADASTQADAVASATSSSSSSTSDAALLQQLKQLLQQALVAASGTPQQNNTDTKAATTLLAANDISANSKVPATADATAQNTPATDNNASLKQTLDQLIALLQGNTTVAKSADTNTPATAAVALTAATTVNTLGTQQDTAANTQSAASNIPDPNADADAVIKLAQALEDKLNSTQSTATAATETTQAATATAAANAVATSANANTPKAKTSDVTDVAQPVTTTGAATTDISSPQNTILQSAVSQLTGFIANNHDSKTSSDITDASLLSTSISAQTANANNIGANVTTANHNNNQAPATGINDFTKFLSSNTTSTPASDQVLVQIRNQANQGASQIRIQLQPEDLGRVTVQMNTGTDGKTGVTVTADNRQTLSMLQSDARHLEAALRNVGIKTTSGGLSFNLSSQQQQGQQNPAKQGTYTQVAAATTTDNDADYYGTVVALYKMSAKQGLDIRV